MQGLSGVVNRIAALAAGPYSKAEVHACIRYYILVEKHLQLYQYF
jgi:hypothetical protein